MTTGALKISSEACSCPSEDRVIPANKAFVLLILLALFVFVVEVVLLLPLLSASVSDSDVGDSGDGGSFVCGFSKGAELS